MLIKNVTFSKFHLIFAKFNITYWLTQSIINPHSRLLFVFPFLQFTRQQQCARHVEEYMLVDSKRIASHDMFMLLAFCLSKKSLLFMVASSLLEILANFQLYLLNLHLLLKTLFCRICWALDWKTMRKPRKSHLMWRRDNDLLLLSHSFLHSWFPWINPFSIILDP